MRISRFEFSDLQDFRPKAEAFVLNEVVEEMKQEEIVVPPKPTFSEEQLAAAKDTAHKTGFAEGFEAGLAEARQANAERERDLIQLMGQLELQFKAQQDRYDAMLASENREIGQLVIAIARKIAGEALTQRPELAIQELLGHCLPIILQKPRAVIEVNPQMLDVLSERITPFLARAGYEGDVQFRPNPELGPHDAIVEWAGGKAERHTETMWQEIELMINQLSLAQPSTPRE